MDIRKRIEEIEHKLQTLKTMKENTECNIDNLVCNLCKIRKKIKMLRCTLKQLLIEEGCREMENKIRDEIRELQKVKSKVGKEERCIQNQICRRIKQIKMLQEKTKQRMACFNSA